MRVSLNYDKAYQGPAAPSVRTRTPRRLPIRRSLDFGAPTQSVASIDPYLIHIRECSLHQRRSISSIQTQTPCGRPAKTPDQVGGGDRN